MVHRSTRLEVLIGRSLAVSVHPYAAWQSRSVRYRAFLLCTYAVVGYVCVFGALQVLALWQP